MEKTFLEDKVVYRAEKGKKLKFKHNNNLFKEIIVKKETGDILEVEENE